MPRLTLQGKKQYWLRHHDREHKCLASLYTIQVRSSMFAATLCLCYCILSHSHTGLESCYQLLGKIICNDVYSGALKTSMQLFWLLSDCHSYIKMLICLQTTLSMAVKLCAERTFCQENICLQKWKLYLFKCLSCTSKGKLLIWKQSKHFRIASLLTNA